MISAIIQCRTNSTRLPQKALRMIGGHPMIHRVIERTKRIPEVDKVVVATSDAEADQWIPSYCKSVGVESFVGPLDNVLKRYEACAQWLNLSGHDLIVRITADCPALDPAVSSQVIQLHLEGHSDYTANLRDWPDGLDTEVFSRVALQNAYFMSASPEEQEHVTPWMRANLFCLELPLTPPQRWRKWSVDTPEELDIMRGMYAVLGEDFGWQEIVRWQARAGAGGASPGGGPASVQS